MNRRIAFLAIGLAAVAALAALIGGAVRATGSESQADRETAVGRYVHRVPFRGAVYELTIVADVGGRTARATEWVAPESSTWRIHAGDRIYISAPRHYVVVDGDHALPYIRTGSPVFLGNLRDLSFGLAPLRRHLGLDRTLRAATKATRESGKTTLHVAGSQERTVTIERRLAPEVARRQGIFSVSWATGRNEFREVPVGRPSSLGVRAYWLGPQAGERRAVIATEWVRTRTAEEIAYGIPPRSESEVHTTIYAAPGAHGRNSAIPGIVERPAGEMQVVSEPLSSPHAQVVLRAIDGQNGDLTSEPWPRTTIRLRGGESATVVADQADSSPDARTSFLVIVGDTLVSVVGSFTDAEVTAVARTLRPIG
jgi:hypothetical protein